MFNEEVLSASATLKRDLLEPFALIRDALRPDCAEHLRHALATSDNWQRDVIVADDFVSSRWQINMLGRNAPPVLSELTAYLRSPVCLQWINSIAQRNCNDFYGYAVRMTSGDLITPHNDRYVASEVQHNPIIRAVAFNYYLTRNWRAEWGGHLVWTRPSRRFIPEFNMLVMFLVGPDSEHSVTAVSDSAAESRLSISGWFTKHVKKLSPVGDRIADNDRPFG